MVVGGTLYAPTEQFTWSLSLYRPSTSGPPPATVPTAVINATSAFFTASALISNGAQLRWIKLNQIGADGRYTEPSTVQYDYPTPYPTGASTTIVAPQISLAITLRTAVERGAASKGRFYMPLPARALTSAGVMGSSDQTSIATFATTYLNALNAALDPWRVSVLSDTGAGAARPVTHVDVGRVLDTIRSRRRSFTEVYVSGAPLATS